MKAPGATTEVGEERTGADEANVSGSSSSTASSAIASEEGLLPTLLALVLREARRIATAAVPVLAGARPNVVVSDMRRRGLAAAAAAADDDTSGIPKTAGVLDGPVGPRWNRLLSVVEAMEPRRWRVMSTG